MKRDEAPLRMSVVALTRDRPKEFRALLEALALQRLPDFEVIVVGGEPSAEDHGAPPALARRVTYAQCVEQNISKSRNIGLRLARGEFIAFIDDDAAPEPDWLDQILAGFAKPDVGAVGGFVRGRNGVDFQWRGAVVDRYGGHRPLTSDDIVTAEIGGPDAEFFLSTVGVNSAFRRAALIEVGGFDENYHYFLDESDICIRLLRAGWRTVLSSDAEVHHAYAESSERRRNRAPRDLFQIAASRAYFGALYGHEDWREEHIRRFCDDQKRRLSKFVQLGRLSRRQSLEVLDRLEQGLIEGGLRFDDRKPPKLPKKTPKHRPAEAPFRSLSPHARPRVALVVGGNGRNAVYAAARTLAAADCEVTIIDFGIRPKRLRVWFKDGIWMHVGGILGRDKFDAPLPKPRRCLRAKRELNRVADRRKFDAVVRPKAKKFRIGDLRASDLDGHLHGFVVEPMRPGGGVAVIERLKLDKKRRGAPALAS